MCNGSWNGGRPRSAHAAMPAGSRKQRLLPPPLLPAVQALSLAGGLLNVLRIPERWLQPADPGKAAPLDHLLNSHQVC